MNDFRLVFNKSYTLLTLALLICSTSCNKENLKKISEEISHEITLIRDEELGISFIEKLYSNFRYISNNENVSDSVKLIAHKLEAKINNIFSFVTNTSLLLESVNKFNAVPSVLMPCFKGHDDVTEFLINNSDLIINANAWPDKKLDGIFTYISALKKNLSQSSETIKRQYFISEKVFKEFEYSPFKGCRNEDESIIWNNYMRRNIYHRKNIVLLIDHGGSLTKKQFVIMKKFAKNIISSLKQNDKISVIAVSSDLTFPELACKPKNMQILKDFDNILKESLELFIDSLLQENSATNHTLGVQKALEIMLNSSHLVKNETMLLLYVSRGLLSSLAEPKSIMDIIAQYTNKMNGNLVINTCALIDDTKPVMYETRFLRDIAEQNFTRYNISVKNNKTIRIGSMFSFNDLKDVEYTINKIYTVFNKDNRFYTGKHIHLPTWDSNSKDLIVSFTIGLMVDKKFSFIGVDSYFSDLAEDITYYSNNPHYSYAFLMDLNGKILMHPTIPSPEVKNGPITFVDIKLIEKVDNIDVLRTNMLNDVEGVFVTTNNRTEQVEYTWKRAGEWYVVCIVHNNNYGLFNVPYKAPHSNSVSKLLYQHLPETEEFKLCRHFNQISTLDVASLFLSMSCFKSPFSASRTTQDKLIVQGYLAYLKDSTGLLINPGLKYGIRDEVSALARIMDFLKKKHLTSNLSQFIVRRYAASYNGVLQMFPGSVLKSNFDPAHRPWFVRSVQHRGKITLTSPYQDSGGAGYIVTLAYATPHVVVALDLTYGFMLRLILREMPFCSDKKVTCFLIDDQGYIVYHPNLMDVNGARPVEQQHIVHRESLVANDILNHKHFIRKLLCNSYSNNTVQRFYKLNTSFTDVLANYVPGEHCVTYRIVAVPNTNIFVGVVNASCDVVAAFCPCSIIDRLCLNCKRMEQKECECPCECPLSLVPNSCRKESVNNMTDNLPCTDLVQSSSSEPEFISEVDNNIEIKTCFSVSCQNKLFQMDCVGLLGCEWCQYDMEGNYLKKPFCSPITECFNGIFGLRMPYKNNVGSSNIPVDSDYSPVGPVLATIIAMCVLFILLFICYRSYTSPTIDRLYLSSTQDHLRMSDINVNDLGNHRDKLLKEDCPDHVSPYCVAGTYRRNNTAADSDHGYSTMTPHDESEHMSLAPIEVDSLEDDLASDSTSVHTSISTRKSGVTQLSSPMFTKLPSRNCVVVPVTVHRHMETT